MKKIICAAASTIIALTGCVHDGKKLPVHTHPLDPQQVSFDERTKIAKNTCEAQYEKGKQNYLSAIQAAIKAENATPKPSPAPLDRFRAEINASYNTVVMRCKTHMNCLEVQMYDEARCYMSAVDRREAERQFSDLSQRLRQIERDFDKKQARHKAKKPGMRVNVETNVTQSNDQTTDTHIGDDIEDQDVLVLCGHAGNLLKRKCRQGCAKGRC